MSPAHAALDLGTNSTRFLCLPPGEGTIAPADVPDRGSVITRLGENLDASGRISPSARRRVLDAVKEFDERVERQEGRWVGGLATSACRRADSESVESLFDGVETITGIRPQILTGRREATYTYRGIRRVFPDLLEGRIVDIGGGSTEWVCFDREGLRAAASLPIGVVTLRERCVKGPRWTSRATRCVREQIGRVFPPEEAGRGPLVGVGGTPTTLSALHHDLSSYQAEVVHGDVLDREVLRELRTRLSGLSFEEIGRSDVLQKGRADVLLPGLLLLERCLEAAEVDRVTVSDLGILVGFITERRSP